MRRLYFLLVTVSQAMAQQRRASPLFGGRWSRRARTRMAAPLTSLALAVTAGAMLHAQSPEEAGRRSQPVTTLNAGLGVVPASVVRDTPQAAVRGYLDVCRAGDFETAAHYLDLSGIDPDEQREQGPRLARRLKFVLDQKLWVDLESLSAEPDGQLDDGLAPLKDELGTIEMPSGDQAVRLQRVRIAPDTYAWVFTESLVQAIGPLYRAFGPGWLGDRLPPWMLRYRVWELELWQLLGLLVLVPMADVVRRILARPLTSMARRLARRTDVQWDNEIADILPRPLSLLLGAILIAVGATFLHLARPAQEVVSVIVRSTMLVALGLFGHRAVVVAGRALRARLTEGETDARRLKGITTRVTVLQRIGSGLLIFVVAAFVLAQFELVRTVGISLLASAGVAGIVLGFAAQRSVANLFAGIQIMLTQPISIGDVVIVEGEWGTIEEITFTHVVVKIWDLRRLVVPIAYFLERPFQNWTRASTELLGTIYFYTDHTIDLPAMRAELDRILAQTDLWDGKAKGVVVTGMKDHVVEVRALVSAADSGKAWDLRCLVRERMLDWLQREGRPLPTLRLEVDNRERAAKQAEP